MNEFVKIILTNILPPLISVGVGGILVAYFAPRLQKRFERTKLYDRRKMELSEEIVDSFTLYVSGWRRLINVLNLQKTRDLSEVEAARKAGYIVQRDSARDKLIANLHLISLYASPAFRSVADEFNSWDTAQASKRLEELPPVEEWEHWRARIQSGLQSEMTEPHRRALWRRPARLRKQHAVDH